MSCVSNDASFSLLRQSKASKLAQTKVVRIKGGESYQICQAGCFCVTVPVCPVH